MVFLGSEITYENWYNGTNYMQPDNQGYATCLSYNLQNAEWRDTMCTTKQSSLCLNCKFTLSKFVSSFMMIFGFVIQLIMHVEEYTFKNIIV